MSDTYSITHLVRKVMTTFTYVLIVNTFSLDLGKFSDVYNAALVAAAGVRLGAAGQLPAGEEEPGAAVRLLGLPSLPYLPRRSRGVHQAALPRQALCPDIQYFDNKLIIRTILYLKYIHLPRYTEATVSTYRKLEFIRT
jgi:hypothetical protein